MFLRCLWLPGFTIRKELLFSLGNPLMSCLALLLPLSRFFVCVLGDWLCDTCRCGYLSLSCLEFVELVDVKMNIFHQIWAVCVCYFWKYSFCPFLSLSSSGNPTIPVLVLVRVSHKSLGLCLFFCILYSFCFLD